MRISSTKTNIPYRKTAIPPLQDSEYIILQSQGGYKHNRAFVWKIAHGFLTNQRFVIFMGRTVRFEIALSRIRDLAVEKTVFIIRTKQCLCVSYQAEKGSGRNRIWFLANDIEKWRKRIYQLSLLRVDQETIEKIAAQLDSDSQDILWYLWEKRHARINQLAELIDAPNHMYVLLKIREIINPISEKVIDCPILSFERSRVDSETGEAVLFSWWMIGHQERLVHREDRLLDIFDEGPYIQVIMEVRGVEASDLRLDVHKDQLTVRSHKIGATLRETFRLPAQVRAHNHQMHLKNNLLEIRLSKVQDTVISGQ